ncbi:unnamed protein product [Strongylus vulgaris]|uniref:Uncharacterized protein n=1 Tax=Strongylus vulgaris TaxID=40348 RepID=A0A3P7IQ67_STRVU|nr:unnamed protein product [Strongylus vulgaris]
MLCKKDQWFRERCCGGVDLNRNFDWFWGEVGSSSDRCSEIYQGKSPFSEAEARAVRDAMFSPDLRGKVDAFLTLHTYSQMWIHPFSHQRKTVPEDINDIEQVGRRAISALESVYGTKYRFGTGADILYPSSGGSDDWAKGKGGAKYVYLMELRPGEEVWDGFILDSRQLIPTGRETWAGIKVTTGWSTTLNPTAPFIFTPTSPRTPGITALPKFAITKAPVRFIAFSSCFDRSPWCAAWLERNPQVCIVSSIFMRRDCSRTCRFC